MYWNDEKLTVEPYDKIKKVYVCGKELLRFDGIKTAIYTILIVDLNECCCADVYSDGEVIIKFSEHSSVPHKMKVGGQSAKRFSQIRENEITLWFKRINEYVKTIGQDIHLGINFMYKNRFIKTLNTYNKQKVKEIRKTEYSGISGIYQYVNKLEAEK